MAKSQTLKIFKMRIGDPIYAFFGIAGFSLYAHMHFKMKSEKLVL